MLPLLCGRSCMILTLTVLTDPLVKRTDGRTGDNIWLAIKSKLQQNAKNVKRDKITKYRS